MKVLIFSSSAGNGHNSTAKRISEKILSEDKNATIEIVDSYKSYASKFKAWIMEDGYFFSLHHLLKVYNYFFKKSEKCTYEKRNIVNANKDSYCLMFGMLKKIYDFKPDVIISTYIFCSVALSNLRRVYDIPAKIISMTLDYGISPYWECCCEGLDYMFLTNDYMLEPFKQKGFKDEQLIVSGIPVAEKFENNDKDKFKNNEKDKIALAKKNNLDPDLFTILIMKASFFSISNKNIVKELKKINKKVQVVIVNGKNQKNKLDMQKRIDKANLQHKILNLGFINNVEDYLCVSDLVIGKGGGLSLTESLNAGIPVLIVNNLPQQEVYNKDFLVNNKCAIEVNKNTIAKTINEILENEEIAKDLTLATKKVRKLKTLSTYAQVIMNCPQADYSNIKDFNDSKHKLIKRVDKERKKAIKQDKETLRTKKQK